jgi:hypothetical protein
MHLPTGSVQRVPTGEDAAYAVELFQPGGDRLAHGERLGVFPPQTATCRSCHKLVTAPQYSGGLVYVHMSMFDLVFHHGIRAVAEDVVREQALDLYVIRLKTVVYVCTFFSRSLTPLDRITS